MPRSCRKANLGPPVVSGSERPTPVPATTRPPAISLASPPPVRRTSPSRLRIRKWSTNTVLNPRSILPDRKPQINPFSTNHSCPLQPHSLPLPMVYQPHATHISQETLPLTLPPYFQRPARKTSLIRAISQPEGPNLFTSDLSFGPSLLPLLH